MKMKLSSLVWSGDRFAKAVTLIGVDGVKGSGTISRGSGYSFIVSVNFADLAWSSTAQNMYDAAILLDEFLKFAFEVIGSKKSEVLKAELVTLREALTAAQTKYYETAVDFGRALQEERK